MARAQAGRENRVMASMTGIVDQARAFLPEFVTRHLRTDQHGELFKRRTGQTLAPNPELAVDPALHVPDPLMSNVVLGDPKIFATLALQPDTGALIARLDILLARGVGVESLFVDVIAPAARHLGDLWDDDVCDFVDVTMGLWRLQEVVRDVSSRLPVTNRAGDTRTVLFASMPGEQHSLGTVMIEDMFRRDGWATEILVDCGRSDLLDALARRRTDLVGLTVSLDANIAHLASLIVAMRSVSRNPRLSVMLGGRVLSDDPELITRVGADATATDAQHALEVASRLVAANACREVFCA